MFGILVFASIFLVIQIAYDKSAFYSVIQVMSNQTYMDSFVTNIIEASLVDLCKELFVSFIGNEGNLNKAFYKLFQLLWLWIINKIIEVLFYFEKKQAEKQIEAILRERIIELEALSHQLHHSLEHQCMLNNRLHTSIMELRIHQQILRSDTGARPDLDDRSDNDLQN